MKLTVIFVCLTGLQAIAHPGDAQTVTLHMKNKPVQRVFKEVSRQTGVSIVYNETLFAGFEPVTIKVSGATIQQVLDRCLQNQAFDYTVRNGMIVIRKTPEIPKFHYAELAKAAAEVTGKVVDEQGVPVIGATVTVKNSRTATATDINGEFHLNGIPDDAVLIISGVSIETQEIALNGRSSLSITVIQTATELNTAVVIGYGTIRRKDLTGAVGMVKGDVMENNAVPQIGQALQGKIAGLQIRQTSGAPGAGVEIRVRGMGTFGAGVNPLVVVDGIITSEGLNDIDPSNVEDITVLKDASAAAIYGSRGANGVVIVTTKRGKAGKTNIDLQAYYSMDNVIRKIPTVDAATYGQMVNEYYTNQGKPAPFDDPASFGKGTNWQDEIFRTGGKQNYALTVSGGSEKSVFAMMASYYQGNGIVVNSKYDRGNFRINNDINPFKGFKIGSSLGITYGKSKGGNPQEAIDRALIYAPTVKPYNEDGTYGIASRAGEPTTMVQPLVAAYERNRTEKRIRALGNVYAEYEIIKGLTFRNNWSVEYNNFDGSYFTPRYNFGLGNSNGDAFLDRNTNNSVNWMVDNILTYKTNFNNMHDLEVMIGHTYQEQRWESLTGYTNGFTRNDENLQVPDFGPSQDRIGGTVNEWAIQSFLGRLNYSYKGKYLVTSNVRVDQSSRFAKENRTGVFPSLSLGWVLSEEDFFANMPAQITFLKLRGGFGILGNQDIAPYPYQSLINSNLFYSLGTGQEVWTGASPTALANRDLVWEKTQTTSVGLEANFFTNKLQVSLDYYNRFTTDILSVVPLPVLSGLASFPVQNIGRVRNSGVEITMDWRNNSANGDFSYNIGFNLTLNKNRVTRLNKQSEIVYWDARIAEGRQILDFYGYVHDGVFQTPDDISKAATQPNAAPGDIRFKDMNEDGVINELDRTYIGSNLGKQFLGLHGTVKYKNFDLTIAMNGDFGRDRVIDAPGFAITRGAEQTNGWFYSRWTGPGTSNHVPRIVGGDPNGNSRFSTFWLASQDYLRIQNLQLGYDFSDRIIRNSGLNKLRVYVAAQNLATFTDYPGFDPEMNASTYPISRSIFFGVNLGLK